MSETVHVALGARSYDVSIGGFTADAIADRIAAALDPNTTGVAVRAWTCWQARPART